MIFRATILGVALIAGVSCDPIQQRLKNTFESTQTASQVNLEMLELQKQGKLIDALRTGEQFLLEKPSSDAIIHKTLARIYTAIGDLESASSHLQHAESKTPHITEGINSDRLPSPQNLEK